MLVNSHILEELAASIFRGSVVHSSCITQNLIMD